MKTHHHDYKFAKGKLPPGLNIGGKYLGKPFYSCACGSWTNSPPKESL